jgi:hypothetical protein
VDEWMSTRAIVDQGTKDQGPRLNDQRPRDEFPKFLTPLYSTLIRQKTGQRGSRF